MCDIMEFDYEEVDDEEPTMDAGKVIVPIPLARPRK
jgi:hypothetical protein